MNQVSPSILVKMLSRRANLRAFTRAHVGAIGNITSPSFFAGTEYIARTFASTAKAEASAEPHTGNVRSHVLHRTLKSPPLQVVSANDKHITFANGHQMMDTTGGAAVACIGYNNKRVKQAMIEQIDKFAYVNSMFFGHPIGEALAAELIDGTEGAMSKAYIVCSGSEAMESAMKMARQYFIETRPKQAGRVNFIAREGSYHGTTLGSLSMSGHVGRRKIFEDSGLLLQNIHRVSACNPYRGMRHGQSVEEYVRQLADELDRKFQELGPDTVCAFVAEPVVGAVCILTSNLTEFWLILYLLRHWDAFPLSLAISKPCEKYATIMALCSF